MKWENRVSYWQGLTQPPIVCNRTALTRVVQNVIKLDQLNVWKEDSIKVKGRKWQVALISPESYTESGFVTTCVEHPQ